MTRETRDDAIGAISVVATAELLVVIAIIIGAAIGMNIGPITAAIANWIG